MKTRIEYHSRPDAYNRVFFTLYWKAQYIPGLPCGDGISYERGQCFFTDPRKHGHPLPTRGGQRDVMA